MKIKLKSRKLVNLRRDLKKEMDKMGEGMSELVRLNQEHEIFKHKINRLKEKGLKILDKVLKEQHKMDEFDYFINYEAIDDEMLECEINNVLEDILGDPEGTKNKLRDDKKKKEGMYKDLTMYTGHECE